MFDYPNRLVDLQLYNKGLSEKEGHRFNEPDLIHRSRVRQSPTDESQHVAP